MKEELDVLGWTAEDLQGRRKSHPQKIRIAARLRRETVMTLEWIANRLCMGVATHVAALLQRQNLKPENSGKTLF
jgi:hypothetical protein